MKWSVTLWEISASLLDVLPCGVGESTAGMIFEINQVFSDKSVPLPFLLCTLWFFVRPRVKSVSSFDESAPASSGMGAARIESVRKKTASRRDLMINIWRGEYGLNVEDQLDDSIALDVILYLWLERSRSIVSTNLTTFVLPPAPGLSVAVEKPPPSTPWSARNK